MDARLMRACTLLIFCWSILTAVAIPRPESREVLKNLAKLPTPPEVTVVQYDPIIGFYLAPEVADASEDIREVRSQMKGNAQDAELTLQVAQANRRAMRRATASRQFRTASEQFKARIKVEPSNHKLWLQLAEALTAVGEIEEAQYALRQAETFHAEPRRLALCEGNFHKVAAWKLLEPYVLATEEDRFGSIRLEDVDKQSLEEAESHLVNARDCFDRYLSLDNKQGSAYLERANFELFDFSITKAIKEMKGGHLHEAENSSLNLPQRAREDFSKGFELTPTPENMVIAYYLLGRESSARSHSWNLPSYHGERMVKDFVVKLERMAEAQDPDDASVANECLGILQAYALNDFKRASESFRLATQLSPKRDRAWNLWANMTLARGDYPALVEIWEERVSQFDNAKNRLGLAKAYELAGKTAEAEMAVAEAFSLNSNDFYANLAVANALIRRSDGETYVAQIEASIAKAEKALSAIFDQDAPAQLAITKSIFYGLTGDSERARTALDKWVNKGKYPQVQEILVELGI